jgi:hypothetical protein
VTRRYIIFGRQVEDLGLLQLTVTLPQSSLEQDVVNRYLSAGGVHMFEVKGGCCLFYFTLLYFTYRCICVVRLHNHGSLVCLLPSDFVFRRLCDWFLLLLGGDMGLYGVSE